MKTFKKKTLMMALFGLLAANSSWELINKDGANYFAGQKIIEEGSISLASKATPGIESVRSTGASKLGLATGKGSLEANLMKLFNQIQRESNDEDFMEIVTKMEKVTAKTKPEIGKYVYKISDIGELENGKEWLQWLREESGNGNGLSIIESQDETWDMVESEANHTDIELTFYKYWNLETEVNGKKANVRMDLVEDKQSLDGRNLVYKAVLTTPEGQVLEDCEICNTDTLLPIPEGKLHDVNYISSLLNRHISRVSKVKDEEEKEVLAKTCDSKKYRTGTDKHLKCLIDRLEGKSQEAKSLTDEEREDIEVNLAEILKEEYMDDPRSDHFDDFFRGNRKFAAMAKKIAKEAKTEIARQEQIEREEERTEMMEDALRDELDYISEAIATLDNRAANFENMFSYASRDIDQRRFQCDSMSPYTSNYSSRNYFNGGYAGVSFNFKDGFQTYSGNYNSRNLVGAPGVNMIGGNNQFAQWQNQWEQMNRQNAEMMRQNCLQNISTVENYWNWELASYEDSYIKPLQQDISSKLSRLDINRIFPKTFRDEDNYNGGIHKEDKAYYASMIRDFQQDLGGMGLQGSSNTDVLYRSAPRTSTPNVGNNNRGGNFRSGNPSTPTTTPGNNRGRFGQRGA
jgi:hypothetical protein